MTSSSSQQTNPDEVFPRCAIVRVGWRGNVLFASAISTPVSTPSSPTGKISPRSYEPTHAGAQLEQLSLWLLKTWSTKKQYPDSRVDWGLGEARPSDGGLRTATAIGRRLPRASWRPANLTASRGTRCIAARSCWAELRLILRAFRAGCWWPRPRLSPIPTAAICAAVNRMSLAQSERTGGRADPSDLASEYSPNAVA